MPAAMKLHPAIPEPAPARCLFFGLVPDADPRVAIGAPALACDDSAAPFGFTRTGGDCRCPPLVGNAVDLSAPG